MEAKQQLQWLEEVLKEADGVEAGHLPLCSLRITLQGPSPFASTHTFGVPRLVAISPGSSWLATGLLGGARPAWQGANSWNDVA